MKELQYLNKYFIKYKYRFLLGLLITIVAQIFSLFTPELIGYSIKVIEDYIKSEHKDVDGVSNKFRSKQRKNLGHNSNQQS